LGYEGVNRRRPDLSVCNYVKKKNPTATTRK